MADGQPAGPTGQPPTADSQSPFDYGHQARQAQFTKSDDTPTDVNLNACYGRNYAETASRRADAVERAMARHEMVAEAILAKIAAA